MAKPFNLPSELCEIIFKYINSCDLLNCCLVSRSWKMFIESTFSKQLLLTIRGDKIDLNDVFNSERHYQRFKLCQLSENRLLEILKFFSTSIMELEIEDCRIDRECDMNFDCLRELTLTDCSTTVIRLFTKANTCVNLKTLNIFQPHGRCPFRNDILTFFKSNRSLEEINLNLNESCNIFSKDISKDLKMNLKSVFLSFKSDCELQTTTLVNIENFFRSQGETIQTISLINSANLPLLHRIWNSLKVVKRLYFFSSDPFFDYDTSTLELLENNSNLLELELHALGPFTLELKDLTPFILSSNNLKALGVWTLRKDLIEFVAYNHSKLKFISCATMERDCENYYNDLKSKFGINDKLHLHQYL
ncbi:hypothetical protein PVAND_013986 [Polypedilum vanderplanki]|uniref:F-box domain-containing protein n=1 Tax=Polypedilum vanderplanki TaxID=319348 RepID=A0A9J6CRW2_POLVA|nr:hypothetical protein PVAND_013986 [Polypedilum vanderplanki]